MKHIILFLFGCAVGGVSTHYIDNAAFHAKANASMSAGVGSAAQAAQSALK